MNVTSTRAGSADVSCPYALPIPNAIPMTTRAAILRDMTFSFASLLPSAHHARRCTRQKGKGDAGAQQRTCSLRSEALCEERRADRPRSSLPCGASGLDARCVMPHSACVFGRVVLESWSVRTPLRSAAIALHSCGTRIDVWLSDERNAPRGERNAGSRSTPRPEVGGRLQPNLVLHATRADRGGLAAARMAWTRLRGRPHCHLCRAARAAGLGGAGRTGHSLRAPRADRDDGNCRLCRIAQRHPVTEATARPRAGLRSRRRVRHCRRTTLGRRSPTV